eukprot:m.167421 g.167421  ORF g.167421 m.167421 type:complete len:554 (-) comp9901_c1_seq2:60-1721(-)
MRAVAACVLVAATLSGLAWGEATAVHAKSSQGCAASKSLPKSVKDSHSSHSTSGSCAAGDADCLKTSAAPASACTGTIPTFFPTIKNLFTEVDHTAMLQIANLDLWDYDTVQTQAQTIYNMVSSKLMPCNASGEPKWDDAKLALFATWMNCGTPPGGSAPVPNFKAFVPNVCSNPVAFDPTVKNLFRVKDRNSMLTFGIDLWNYESVKTHAEAIYTRVKAGTMPCDGRWPASKVAIFQHWIACGRPELPADIEIPHVTPAAFAAPEPAAAPVAASSCDASVPTFIPTIRDLFTDVDHDAMMSHGLDLWDYANVKNMAKLIYVQVKSGEMPPPAFNRRWNQTYLATFKHWMDCGMPPGSPLPVPQCVQPAPTFYPVIKSMFRSLDHDAMNQKGINLWNYTDVSRMWGLIYMKVKAKQMPCANSGNPWTPLMVEVFKNWTNCGLPEGIQGAPYIPPPVPESMCTAAPTFYGPGPHPIVKDMFSVGDRTSMLQVQGIPNAPLDLWDYTSVKAMALDIYWQLSSGNMPCYGAWEPSKIATFKLWIDCGLLEGAAPDS